MPGFEITLSDVQAFEDIDLFTDVRLSGTFTSHDDWTLDYVEVPGTRRRGDWKVINKLHPLWGTFLFGIGKTIDSQPVVDKILAAIQAEIDECGGLRELHRVAAE